MEEILTYIKRNKMTVLAFLIILSLTGGYFLTYHTKPVVKNELQTEIKARPEKKDVKPKSKQELVVDIQGAIKNPGVYRVKTGAIVQEVIKMAGGPNANADTKRVNQAKRVTDQMQVYIPNQGEKSAPVASGSGGGQDKQVNINTATVADFKDVTGIGPKKAEKIIAYREKNGNFQELHDLTKVSGIGEKSLDSLKDQLTV